MILGGHLAAASPDVIVIEVADGLLQRETARLFLIPEFTSWVDGVVFAANESLGAQAGVVLNPSTPVGCLEEVAADVDFVLLMTVNPGFGGQAFIPRSTSKVQAMRALLDEAGNAAPIEVDGGIDESNIARVVAAGADWIVAGSAVFGSDDAESATRRLKALAVAAAQERLALHRGAR